MRGRLKLKIAAFDIGSTNFRYVLGNGEGEFLSKIFKESTRAGKLEKDIVKAVEKLNSKSGGDPDFISISSSGRIDHENAVIEEFDDSEGKIRKNIEIGSVVKKEFGIPTFIENDCNAAVLGEVEHGDTKSYRCVAYLTLSTGIGGGIFENGKIIRGEHGHASEVGLAPVKYDGSLKSQGVRGAWEAYCAGRGIPEYVEKLIEGEDRETSLTEKENLTSKHVFDAARDGDEVAKEFVEEIGKINASGIGCMVNHYNPGIIKIGGSIALNNPELVLKPIERHLEKYIICKKPEIELTDLGDDIGLYGSLAIPLHRKQA